LVSHKSSRNAVTKRWPKSSTMTMGQRCVPGCAKSPPRTDLFSRQKKLKKNKLHNLHHHIGWHFIFILAKWSFAPFVKTCTTWRSMNWTRTYWPTSVVDADTSTRCWDVNRCVFSRHN
jgi:hypothetical protein